MASISGVRVRDPPDWREAERIGRVSYLPPRAMSRTYRSELRRRELMAAEAADWRRLTIEIADRERSDAVIEYLATAFAECLRSFYCADPTVDAVGGLQIKIGYDYGHWNTATD